MKPSLFLAWLGGAQPALLRDSPGDAARYNSMGAVLLGTAGMASLSATFALNTAVGLPVVPAAVIGVLWGLLILSLDRMLVISMARRSGFWRAVAAAAPRLLLALLIGAVISVPLVLRIFQPEIEAELRVMHSENLTANQQKLDQQFADIKPMQDKVDRLQPIANGETQPNVNDDPDVKAALAELQAAQAAYTEAARLAQCELDGSCGTGRPGPGGAYQSARANADRALDRLNAARTKLAQVEQAAATRISASSTAARDAAKVELDATRKVLDARVAARAEAQRRLDAAEEDNTGLLARLEALDRLSSGRPTMLVAHWALILLFACVELLPVLAKLLSNAGPPTLYDQLVDRREQEVLDADEVWRQRQAEVVALRVEARMDLERDRTALQVEGGKRANARLAARQQELADRAIDVWAEVAQRRADDELARWYAQHSQAQARQVPVSRLPIDGPPQHPEPFPTTPVAGS